MEVEILQEWSRSVMKMCFTWALSSSSIMCVGALQKDDQFYEFVLLCGYTIIFHRNLPRNESLSPFGIPLSNGCLVLSLRQCVKEGQ